MDIREKVRLLLGLKKLPEGDFSEERPLKLFSDEELETASEKAKAVFSAAREERDLETAEEAYSIHSTVVAEQEARKEEMAAQDERFNALATEIEGEQPETTDTPEVTDPPADPDPSGDDTGDDTDDDKSVETPAEVTAATDPKDEKAEQLKEKLVAAAARPIVPRASAAPSTASPVRIVASADVSDFSPGMTMSMEDMGRAFVEKAKAAAGSRSRVKSKVAKVYLDGIPAAQSFDRSSSAEENTARINEMVSEVREETAQRLRQIAGSRDADEVIELTAAGGFCRPFPINYDLCSQGDDVRPLRDSLVSTRLERGGIQYFTPPRLAAVDGSVNIYTEEQDATGYDYPKGCIRVECPDTEDAVVQAITLCMEVGNFQRLAWPEIFQTWWQFGKVLHARTAEEALWDAMLAGSDARTANPGLGAFRNTITELERYAQQYRYEFRLAASAPLRLWIPYWMVSQLRADLTNQVPGDGTVALTDAQLFQYIASLNIAVTPILDGQDPGTGDDPLPVTAIGILAQEGTWVFGEMGELDFGTEIRDWDQIRNNDSGAFMETFETAYKVCWGSQKITFNLCPTGETVAPVASPIDCAS